MPAGQASGSSEPSGATEPPRGGRPYSRLTWRARVMAPWAAGLIVIGGSGAFLMLHNPPVSARPRAQAAVCGLVTCAMLRSNAAPSRTPTGSPGFSPSPSLRPPTTPAVAAAAPPPQPAAPPSPRPRPRPRPTPTPDPTPTPTPDPTPTPTPTPDPTPTDPWPSPDPTHTWPPPGWPPPPPSWPPPDPGWPPPDPWPGYQHHGFWSPWS